RMVQTFPFPLILDHDVKQRFQRRTRLLVGAIFEIHSSNTFLCRDDIVHSVGKNLHVLQLGPKHFFCEDYVRVIEDAPEERMNEARGDAVPESAGQNLFPTTAKILTFFEETVGDEELRITLRFRHAAPDFWSEKADVMIDTQFRADISSGGQ